MSVIEVPVYRESSVMWKVNVHLFVDHCRGVTCRDRQTICCAAATVVASIGDTYTAPHGAARYVGESSIRVSLDGGLCAESGVRSTG